MLDKGCRVRMLQKKVKPKKLMSIGIFVMLIGVFISGACYYIKANKENITPYGYARWGMSFEECKQVVNQLNPESQVTLEEDQKIICNISDYEGRKDIDALVTLSCEEDGLQEIEVYIINRRGISYTKDELINDYVEMLDGICGEHEKRLKTYVWVAPRSKIQLIDLAANPVVIRYQWINKTLY